MNVEEKAKIVAFARLLGVEGSDKEIIERYSDAYDKAHATFSAEPAKAATGEVFKRPW